MQQACDEIRRLYYVKYENCEDYDEETLKTMTFEYTNRKKDEEQKKEDQVLGFIEEREKKMSSKDDLDKIYASSLGDFTQPCMS